MQRILIIEDDVDIRAMLKKLLERENYQVVIASNGLEGIDAYEAEPCDLVLTDIVMPEKEGIETITELRKKYPDVKIIAMSGGGQGGMANYLHMAKLFGAQCTIAKPFQRAELLSAIEKLLGT